MPADLGALKVAMRQIFLNQTAAGLRVSTGLPDNPLTPYVTYQIRAGPGAWGAWNEGETARLLTLAWAPPTDEIAADNLHTQIRAVLLPTNLRAQGGLSGTYNVTVKGEPRTVNISGVAMNAGPNGYVDPPTGLRVVECYWLINYF